MPSAALRFYHRVDDPWSHLLLQVLPRLQTTYDVNIECFTVPVAPPEYSPRADMLDCHALRDAQDLCRYFELHFSTNGLAPSKAAAALAARCLLSVADSSLYLDLAQSLGEALFTADDARLNSICRMSPMISSEEALDQLERNQQRLLREDHFHGGMIGFGANWYWGVDRLSHLEHDLLVGGHRRTNTSVGLLTHREESSSPSLHIDTGAPLLEIDFYCTFRSPYAYLAAPRVFALEQRYPVRVRPRLMLPMKMAGFVIPESKSRYFRFDPAREALRLGMPFGNFYDPYGRGLERAMALADLAADEGQLASYILSVTRGVWAEGLDLASDEGLRVCVERAGLDWQVAASRVDDQTWRIWADRHRAELAGLGQYAAPTLRLGGYVTWGQDRLPLLEREIRRRLAEATAV